jgi:hypothetical protein
MRVVYNVRWLRRLPVTISAITIGEWVLTPLRMLPNHTLWHEQRHVEQWRTWLYVCYPPAYLIAWIAAGFSYRRNWFERDATRYEHIMGDRPFDA